MSWYEINIKTTGESVEAVSQLFVRYGAGGVKILDPNDPDLQGGSSGTWDFFEPENLEIDFDGVLVTAYLDCDDVEKTCCALEKDVRHLADFGLDPGLGEVSYIEVDPEKWANEWKKYFKPFRIGTHMVVKPSWESYEALPEDVLIEIDPGNAFGSGTHETTSLCIEMLEKHLKSGETVIDVGCGSGILSIAAGKLGAESIVGVDIDPVAVKTAIQNVELNGLAEKIDIRAGNLLDVISEKADIVVANIIAEVIVDLAGDVEQCMKPGARFIASGIITSKIPMVVDRLKALDFSGIDVIEKGEWAVIVAQKPNRVR
ncbi:MAG: ribosomal protein methyltransferase [Clostridiales bacterium]|jgi:ribosomal protein L11 methyltransferase|nr:ribosomal protein methyltransferase [Clostridiales bacterium]